MFVYYASFSEAGSAKANEDSILATEVGAGAYVFAVADGVSGAAGGKLASRLAVDEVQSFFAAGRGVDFEGLVPAVIKRLEQEIQPSDLGLPEPATTLTVCYVHDYQASIHHVGDSRLYHLRGDGLVTRTRDQTEVQRLLDEGILNARTAKHYPRRNVLLSFLAPRRPFQLQVLTIALAPKDRLLLLSDGVSKSLGKTEIRDLSRSSGSVAEFREALLKRLTALKPADDYSAVIVEVT